jgi:hypothetical protein
MDPIRTFPGPSRLPNREAPLHAAPVAQVVSFVPVHIRLVYCEQEVGNPGFQELVGRLYERHRQDPRQGASDHSVRRQAGLIKGDLVNFAFQRGKIVITPKLVIDGSRFPAADDEYTPAQRRIIDASLARADADIKAGRVSKAFSDHAEFIAALHKEAAKLSAKKTKRQTK